MTEVSRILNEMLQGRAASSDELLPLVYRELRELARARMARERGDLSMDATELVHEAYLRLVNANEPVGWESRGHFFAAAAEAMRRILIERARQRQSLKRGGEFNRVEIAEPSSDIDQEDEKLFRLNAALEKLETTDPERAKLVKLRYFAGFTVAEAAQLLGQSKSTAERSWAFTRAWLQTAMED